MNYCVFETQQGYVALAGRDGMLSASTLPQPSSEDALSALRAGRNGGGTQDALSEAPDGFGDLPDRIKSYFRGETADFSDVPIDLTGFGPFHAAAIRAARSIPYGAVVSYGDLARMAGSPRAARAAGGAMASNPAPVIVPCHRVLASGGRIGGFGAGIEWKRSLLRLEGVDI